MGLDPHAVVKTLVMEDEAARPLIVVMHGDREVSTKNLARQAGLKRSRPAIPTWRSGIPAIRSAARRRSARASMPVWVEAEVLDYPVVYINGGRRGYLVGIDPKVLVSLLDAKPVTVALE